MFVLQMFLNLLSAIADAFYKVYCVLSTVKGKFLVLLDFYCIVKKLSLRKILENNYVINHQSIFSNHCVYVFLSHKAPKKINDELFK